MDLDHQIDLPAAFEHRELQRPLIFEGDLLLYFSSGEPQLNRELAYQISKLFGKDGELIEEVEVEG